MGVQFGLSTTVWGFNSGESIDDCEYPQVKGSNQCPEGDLPTRDTHLRHLAPGLTARSQGSEQRKRPKSHGRDGSSGGGARHDWHTYPVAVLHSERAPQIISQFEIATSLPVM